jgi:hypothetical protein
MIATTSPLQSHLTTVAGLTMIKVLKSSGRKTRGPGMQKPAKALPPRSTDLAGQQVHSSHAGTRAGKRERLESFDSQGTARENL